MNYAKHLTKLWVERTAVPVADCALIMTEYGWNFLEALVMLHTHRELTPSTEDVITRFAETGARRLNFLI